MNERQFCVLAVDDSLDILEIIQLALEAKTDWRIVTSPSPKEAIVRAARERPDIILLDVRMPKIDGIETVKKLLACPKTKNIPVLFLTDTPVIISSALIEELGTISVIKKPSNWFNLANLITLSLRSLSLKPRNIPDD
ncbi:MAG: response regulator [Cyanobacteria bacterium P01_A01_bin.40]